MSLKKIFGYFSRIICIIFIIIGLLVFLISIHEFKHYVDLKKENIEVTRICILNIPFEKPYQFGFVGHKSNLDPSEVSPNIYAFIFTLVASLICIYGFIYRKEKEDENENIETNN